MADPGQRNEAIKEQLQLEERRQREFKDQVESRRQVLVIPHEDEDSRRPPGYLPRIATGASVAEDARSELRSAASRSLRSATAPSRRSASATQLSRASASGRQITGSVGHASRCSYRSHRSSEISLHELQKEVAQQEVANIRSALADFKRLKDRARVQSPGHAVHSSVINMGCPQNLVTQQQRTLTLPISMAVNPKWSTDLKRMNDKIGDRMNWERKISGALTGAMCPEKWFMPPQDYPSNPVTPLSPPDAARKYK